jgi:hypothetical protein
MQGIHAERRAYIRGHPLGFATAWRLSSDCNMRLFGGSSENDRRHRRDNLVETLTDG